MRVQSLYFFNFFSIFLSMLTSNFCFKLENLYRQILPPKWWNQPSQWDSPPYSPHQWTPAYHRPCSVSSDAHSYQPHSPTPYYYPAPSSTYAASPWSEYEHGLPHTDHNQCTHISSKSKDSRCSRIQYRRSQCPCSLVSENSDTQDSMCHPTWPNSGCGTSDYTGSR